MSALPVEIIPARSGGRIEWMQGGVDSGAWGDAWSDGWAAAAGTALGAIAGAPSLAISAGGNY